MKQKVTLTREFKRNPFVAPENYFETFAIRKSITLNAGLKQNAFAVPCGYFDTLQERLTEHLASKTQQPSVIRWQPLRAQLAFAASFALLVSIGYGIFSLLRPADAAPDSHYAEIVPKYLSQIIDEPALIHAVANEPKPVAVEVENSAIIRYLADADVSLNEIAAIY
jgi:hypothetical protein